MMPPPALQIAGVSANPQARGNRLLAVAGPPSRRASPRASALVPESSGFRASPRASALVPDSGGYRRGAVSPRASALPPAIRSAFPGESSQVDRDLRTPKAGELLPPSSSAAGSRRPSSRQNTTDLSKSADKLASSQGVSSRAVGPQDDEQNARAVAQFEQELLAATMALAAEDPSHLVIEASGSPTLKPAKARQQQMTPEELEQTQRVIDEHWLVRSERFFRLLDVSRIMHEDKWEDLQKVIHGYRLRVAGIIDGWKPQSGSRQSMLKLLTLSELQAEHLKLAENFSRLKLFNKWRSHKISKKARTAAMDSYRRAKKDLEGTYQDLLHEWRYDSQTNPFKSWMSAEADSRNVANEEGLNSPSNEFQARAKNESPRTENNKEGEKMSTMYWLLLSHERALDCQHRALPVRCRDLLKQLQQHGQLLKQQLRNAQKAAFLDPLLEAFTNVEEDTRKEVEDIYHHLEVAVEAIESDKKVLERHKISDDADLKSMEQKHQRFDLTLKTCLTAVNSESHWLGTMRPDSEGGHMQSMREAREKLVELDEKRPFPMLKNVKVSAGLQRRDTAHMLGLAGPVLNQSKGPADGLDANLVTDSLHEPVLAARSLGRTIQQWQTLAVKRGNQVGKVKQERSTYIAARQRAQEARRKQLAKELSSDNSAQRTFIFNRWQAFKRLHQKFATDNITPLDKQLWQEQNKRDEIKAEVQAVQDEAANLKSKLATEQRQFIRTQTMIHRHPQLMVKSATVHKQVVEWDKKKDQLKIELAALETNIGRHDSSSCVLMSDAISLVRVLADIDNQGAKRLITANPCLKIIKRDVEDRQDKGGKRMMATMKLAKVMQKIDRPEEDEDKKSSSSSSESSGEDPSAAAKAAFEKAAQRRRSTVRNVTALNSKPKARPRTTAKMLAADLPAPEPEAQSSGPLQPQGNDSNPEKVMFKEPADEDSKVAGGKSSAPGRRQSVHQRRMSKAVGLLEKVKAFASAASGGFKEGLDQHDKHDGENETEETKARRRAAQAERSLWKEEVAHRKAQNRLKVVAEKMKKSLPHEQAKIVQKMLEDEAEDPGGVKRLAKEQHDLSHEDETINGQKGHLDERFKVMKAQCLKEIGAIEAMLLEEVGEEDSALHPAEHAGVLEDMAENLTEEQEHELTMAAMGKAFYSDSSESSTAEGPDSEISDGEADDAPLRPHRRARLFDEKEDEDGDAKSDNGRGGEGRRQTRRGSELIKPRRSSRIFKAARLWKRAQKGVLNLDENDEPPRMPPRVKGGSGWDKLLPGLAASARSSKGDEEETSPEAEQEHRESFLAQEPKKSLTRSEELAKSRWEQQKKAIKAALAAQQEKKRQAKEKAQEREKAIAKAFSISEDMERQQAMEPLLNYTPTWDEALAMQVDEKKDNPQSYRTQKILNVFKQRGVFSMFASSTPKTTPRNSAMPRSTLDESPERKPTLRESTLRKSTVRQSTLQAKKSMRTTLTAELQWQDLLGSIEDEDEDEEGAFGGQTSGASSRAASLLHGEQTSGLSSRAASLLESGQTTGPSSRATSLLQLPGSQRTSRAPSKTSSLAGIGSISEGVVRTLIQDEDPSEDSTAQGDAEVQGLAALDSYQDSSAAAQASALATGVPGSAGRDVSLGMQSSASRRRLKSPRSESPRSPRRARLQAKLAHLANLGNEPSGLDLRRRAVAKALVAQPSRFRRPQSPVERYDDALSDDPSDRSSFDMLCVQGSSPRPSIMQPSTPDVKMRATAAAVSASLDLMTRASRASTDFEELEWRKPSLMASQSHMDMRGLPRPLARRSGLTIFLHEFLGEDGQAIGRRTDYVCKGEVPQNWNLREESEEPVVKDMGYGREVHMRWFPVPKEKAPVSVYNENCYCKVANLELDEHTPGRVLIEYEAFGDLTHQDPLESKITWHGGEATASEHSTCLPSNNVIFEDEESCTKGSLIFEGVNTKNYCKFKFGSFGYSAAPISFPPSVPMPADPVVKLPPKPFHTGDKLSGFKMLRNLITQRQTHMRYMLSPPGLSKRSSISELRELLQTRRAVRRAHVGQMLQKIMVRGILRRPSEKNSKNLENAEDGRMSVAFDFGSDEAHGAKEPKIDEEHDSVGENPYHRIFSTEGPICRKSGARLSVALPCGADDAETVRRASRSCEGRSSYAARSRQASFLERPDQYVEGDSDLHHRDRSLTFTLWLDGEEGEKSSTRESSRRQSRASMAQTPTPTPASGMQSGEVVSRISVTAASVAGSQTPPSHRSRAEAHRHSELVDRGSRPLSREGQRSHSRAMSHASSTSNLDTGIEAHVVWDQYSLTPVDNGSTLAMSPVHVFSAAPASDTTGGQTSEAEPQTKVVRRLIEDRTSVKVAPALPDLAVTKRRNAARFSKAAPALEMGMDLCRPSISRASLSTKQSAEDTLLAKARIAGNRLLSLSACQSELGENANRIILDSSAHFFTDIMEELEEEHESEADDINRTDGEAEGRQSVELNFRHRGAVDLQEGTDERMELEALIELMHEGGQLDEKDNSSASSSAGTDDASTSKERNDASLDNADIEAEAGIQADAEIEADMEADAEDEAADDETEEGDALMPENEEAAAEVLRVMRWSTLLTTGAQQEIAELATQDLDDPPAKDPDDFFSRDLTKVAAALDTYTPGSPRNEKMKERQSLAQAAEESKYKFKAFDERKSMARKPAPRKTSSKRVTRILHGTTLGADNSAMQGFVEELPQDSVSRSMGGKKPTFKSYALVAKQYAKSRQKKENQVESPELDVHRIAEGKEDRTELKKERKLQDADDELQFSLVGRQSQKGSQQDTRVFILTNKKQEFGRRLSDSHKRTLQYARQGPTVTPTSSLAHDSLHHDSLQEFSQSCESTVKPGDLQETPEDDLPKPPDAEPPDASPLEKALKRRRHAMVYTFDQEVRASIAETETAQASIEETEVAQPAVLQEMITNVITTVVSQEPTVKQSHHFDEPGLSNADVLGRVSGAVKEEAAFSRIPFHQINRSASTFYRSASTSRIQEPLGKMNRSLSAAALKLRADLGLAFFGPSTSSASGGVARASASPSRDQLAGSASKDQLSDPALSTMTTNMPLHSSVGPGLSVSSESTELTAMPSTCGFYLQPSTQSSTGGVKLSDSGIRNVTLEEQSAASGDSHPFLRSVSNTSATDSCLQENTRVITASAEHSSDNLHEHSSADEQEDLACDKQATTTAFRSSLEDFATNLQSTSLEAANTSAEDPVANLQEEVQGVSAHVEEEEQDAPAAVEDKQDAPAPKEDKQDAPAPVEEACAVDTTIQGFTDKEQEEERDASSMVAPAVVSPERDREEEEEEEEGTSVEKRPPKKNRRSGMCRMSIAVEELQDLDMGRDEDLPEASDSVAHAEAAPAVIAEGSDEMHAEENQSMPTVRDADKLPPGLAEILDSIDDADLLGLADNYKQDWHWDSLTPMFEQRKQDPDSSPLQEAAPAGKQETPRLSLLSGDSPLFNGDGRNIPGSRRVRSAMDTFRSDWSLKQTKDEMPENTQLESIENPVSFFATAVRNSTVSCQPLLEVNRGEMPMELVNRGDMPMELVQAPASTELAATPSFYSCQRPNTTSPGARFARGNKLVLSAAVKPRAAPPSVAELPMMAISTAKSAASSVIKPQKGPPPPNRRRQSLQSVSPQASTWRMWEDDETRTPSPEVDAPLPMLQSRGGTTTASPPWLLSVDPSPSPECRDILRPGTAPGLPLAAGHRLGGPRPESSIDFRREYAASRPQSRGARPESSMDVRRERQSGAQAAPGSRSGAQTSLGSRQEEQVGARRWHAGASSWRQDAFSKAKPPSRQALRLDALLRH